MLAKKRVPDYVWVYGLLLLAVAGMGIVSPGSLEPRHLMDLLRQAAPLGVVAIGQTLILASGNIDLSLGAQITLYNVVLSSVMKDGQNSSILPAVLLTFLVAIGIGLVNGLSVTKLHIPAFVATLATGSVITGVYLIHTQGAPSGSIAPGFRVIAEGWIGGIIPWAAVIWIAAAILVAYVLGRGRFGRELLAVGGNPAAAHVSGLSVDRTLVLSYVGASLLAALSSCLLSAYIGIASITVGEPYTMNSIAATVIGGTPFSGGEATIAGTVGGALIMTVLTAILTALNTGDSMKFIMQGVVIAVMVALYMRRLPSR